MCNLRAINLSAPRRKPDWRSHGGGGEEGGISGGERLKYDDKIGPIILRNV